MGLLVEGGLRKRERQKSHRHYIRVQYVWNKLLSDCF